MGSMKSRLFILLKFMRVIKKQMFWAIHSFPLDKVWGEIGKGSVIGKPCDIGCTRQVFLSDWVNLRYGVSIINTNYEKVIIKKYSVIAPQCTIVTNSHRATVGIPQFILGESHINDKSGDVTIEEDVWIGTRSVILAGVTIGRGAIVGACALVTKDVPPYALVVGVPARIIGVKFSKDGIIAHEKKLYAIGERLSREQLDCLFEKYYNNKKIFGIEGDLTEEQNCVLDAIKCNLDFK